MTVCCPDCNTEYESLGHHISLSNCEYPKITGAVREILNGLVMGDASIWLSGGVGILEVKLSNERYINHLNSVLPDWLISKGGVSLARTPEKGAEKARKYTDKKAHSMDYKSIYRLRSISHPEITEMRNDWYPNGEKRFPDEIEPTPTTLRHWYACDGFLKWSNGYFNGVGFASSNEGNRAREFIPFPTGPVSASGGAIVPVEYTQKILEYMKPIPPGMEYKWEAGDYENYQYLRGEQ